ncbi:MAG: DEAD/DEAH box helicase [Spirochaetaceae bacterium]|nr:DEAD/DEAH box helicase [Spirochaetaceae bacterium]
MIPLVLAVAATAFVANAVRKRHNHSVHVHGDYMEVRFKEYDRAQFYKTMEFVKSLDSTAQFRKLGGDAYWVLPKKPTLIHKLELYGFAVYREYAKDVQVFNRDHFLKEPPWAKTKMKQTWDLWAGTGKKMWRFQEESQRFLNWNDGVGIIGHQMSLGKTAIGLCFLREDFVKRMPALIIVPASVKLQWREEWEKLLHQPVHVLYGKTPSHIPKGTNCIINYDILSAWEKELLKVGFNTVIADEFHKCGNMGTQRTKALRKIAARSPNAVFMSGTAIRSRPSQFFPVLNLVAPNKFPSITQFKDRYCEFKLNSWTGYRQETKGCRNAGELQKILATLMFRKERTDKDVEEDIGIKGNRGKRVPVHIAIQTKKYEEMVGKYKNQYGKSTPIVQKAIRQELSRTAYDLKKDDCIKWISDFMESGEKLVIFCYHRKVMDDLCRAFPKDSVRIDGSVTGNKRLKAAKEFQTDKNLGIFQVLSMGEGIDWIAKVCSFGAFIELPDTVADVEQAEMRFDRPGARSNHILYYYLLAKNTIDEKKMTSIDNGKETFDKIVRGKNSTDESDLLVGLFD